LTNADRDELMQELAMRMRERRALRKEVESLSDEDREALFTATFNVFTTVDPETMLHEYTLNLATACAEYNLDERING
jgi:hypothetical protein